MKQLLLLFLTIITVTAFAQNTYWQQRVDCRINVTLNDATHTLKGNLELTYTNNSPDILTAIPFHLYPNAYKNDKTAFAKQLLAEKDGKKQWKAIKDKGFIDSMAFTVNGVAATLIPDADHIDIGRLTLPQPLKPGEAVRIATPFFVKLPTFASRMGHAEQSYMICQWYPKPAVYDRKGWHAVPYLSMGEFYNDFGNYDVRITLPSAYIVASTGTLQTAKELEQYKAIGTAAKEGRSVGYSNTDATKTLHYTAEGVTDFAWFADKDFLVKWDTTQLLSGKVVDLFAYHHPNGNPAWKNGTDYIKTAVQRYSEWIGEYGFPVAAAVEGPKNESSGGMEYPMVTLITSPDATVEKLDAVITHEVGHNWFPMMVATNERDHTWMDEGINSYYQFLYEADKYRSNAIIGASLPAELKKKNTDEFLAVIYNAFNSVPSKTAIDQTATAFKSSEDYGMTSYVKAAIWMYAMEMALGKEPFRKAMQAYFAEWKGRHPYPEDLKASLERSTGKGLTALFEMLNQKGNF